MEDIKVFEDGKTKKTLVFVLRDDELGKKQVLLGIHHKQLKKNAPGGKVGDKKGFEDETILEAGVRELFEETHLIAKNPEKAGNMQFHFKDGFIVDLDILVVTEFEGELKDSEELYDLKWYSTDELPVEEMWQSDLVWFPYVFKGEYFEGKLFFADAGDVKELYISEGFGMKEIRIV
jgi:ADP-ribose pyrophosphatase YjhB (NUDIX family)